MNMSMRLVFPNSLRLKYKIRKRPSMEVCSHNHLDPNTVLLKINGTACNLHCRYCSEIVKKKDIRMSLEYIHNIFERLPADTSIILHGGEPLLDAHFIDELIHLFRDYRTGKLSIQTNGCFSKEILLVLLNNRKYIKLGISLDGPSEHSCYRAFPNGRASFNCVNSLLDELCEYDFDVKCIATIHSLNHKDPNRFMEYFLSKKNVTQLRINPCFDVSQQGLADYSITPSQFFVFLREIFYLWLNKSLFQKIRIDPIHAAFEHVLSGEHTSNRNCHRFVSIYPQNLCTLCDSFGDMSFICDDWKNLFFQAELYSKAKLFDQCSHCIESSACDLGCIAILKRFQPWPWLVDDYCRYRRNFFSLIRQTNFDFSG